MTHVRHGGRGWTIVNRELIKLQVGIWNLVVRLGRVNLLICRNISLLCSPTT